MGIRFAPLREVGFPILFDTFVAAFSDYPVDMSYLTPERFRNRMLKNGVELSVSPGAFSGGALVGFTLVGLGEHGGGPAAFDAATGIIPAFRGQGLAGRLFQEVLPELRERGIRRFYLEVLSDNEPAIQAYRKAGFTMARGLDSFTLSNPGPGTGSATPAGAEVRPIPRETLADAKGWVAWEPSWEISFTSTSRIPDEILTLGAMVGGELAGCLAYYPALNWLLLLTVSPGRRRRGIGRALLAGLFRELGEGAEPVKVINVDARDEATLAFLDACGAKALLSQHEMMLEL